MLYLSLYFLNIPLNIKTCSAEILVYFIVFSYLSISVIVFWDIENLDLFLDARFLAFFYVYRIITFTFMDTSFEKIQYSTRKKFVIKRTIIVENSFICF